jgi:hypothetical protein
MMSRGVTEMKIPHHEISAALANRTREILVAKRALFAAAAIKIATMVVIIAASLTVLLHALYA